MPNNTVVIGTQWGDEGKGKIVDILTEKADVIIRFQGGNNAGHTLVIGEKKTILHLIPSGIMHAEKKCLIGNGVVLDPEVFCSELDRLQENSLSVGPERLKISNKTHLIMPYHKKIDAAREKKKSDKGKIGTTGRGIGPAYEDKAARIGIRAADVLNKKLLEEKIEQALLEKNALFTYCYEEEPMSAKDIMSDLLPWIDRLPPYLTDVSAEIENAKQEGKTLLFEGAQGTHLDIDHGSYPFVTSSNTVASNAAAGAGCGVSSLDKVLAVVKAYTTRVGSGPFPTELFDEKGQHMQLKGAESGSTTGRKRRCGWLDLVTLRETVRLNDPKEIALTKLDVLSGLSELNLCIQYRYQDQILSFPPQVENGLAMVEPVYEKLSGWSEDISKVKKWDQLPSAAQKYIEKIEDELRVKVSIVSVGPERGQTLFR